MKKTLIIIYFIVCAAFGELIAQTSVIAHANMPFNIERTIIREHVYPATVSYLKTNEGGYFVYADSTMSATYIYIKKEFDISDFVIDNDSVFFCGTKEGGGGFMGFFDISDFFFGSNGYYVDTYTIVASQSTVDTLTKLVSYLDFKFIRHLVSIGRTSSNQYCVVNMVYNAFTASWEYETGTVPLLSPETIVAIEKTDNYILTGGFYFNEPFNPSLSFRCFELFTPFVSSTNIQDFANEIFDASLQHSFCLGQVALVRYSCNEFFAAAFWKNHQDYDTSMPAIVYQDPKGTYVGHYHIGVPKTIIQHNSSILVPHDYYSGKWKLHGFSKLFLQDVTFNLLQEYDFYQNNSKSVVYELSNPIVSYAQPLTYVTADEFYFNSIDGHFAPPNYLMNGFSTYNNSLFVYNMGQQNGNNCLPSGIINTSPIVMTDQPHYAPFTVVSKTTSFNLYISNSTDITIDISCSAKTNR